jgi:hypothetical protein
MSEEPGFKRWPLDSFLIKSKRNVNVLKLFPAIKQENGKYGCDFTKPAKYIFVSAIIDLVEGKRKSVPVSLRPKKETGKSESRS